MQQISFRAMGSQILVILDRTSPALQPILDTVPEWFAAWEQQLSRFQPDSGLMRLNRQRTATNVADPLWTVIQLALEAARRSNGLITPAVLPALEAAGYDRSFELLEDHPSPALQQSSTLEEWREIVCDQVTRTIQLPNQVRLDLGGIAKGWAAQEVVNRLQEHGPVLVDAGGDIAISGPRADGSAWPIGIAHPRIPEQDLALVMLAQGGVATSGCDYRRWRSNGVWQHHLIDPRTGCPAQTDVLAATVVAPGIIQAEVAAKLVLLLGSHAGMAWIEQQPGYASVLVLESGAVLTSQRCAEVLWHPDQN